MENSFEEFVYFNKKKIFIIVFILIILFGIGGFYYYCNYIDKDNGKKEEKENSTLSLEKKEETQKEEKKEEEKCFFDIKGEVSSPGVYDISCDKRIVDAINVSGGLTKNSDTSVLNLSKRIEDGMVIIVYSKTEVKNYLEALKKEEEKNSICGTGNIKNDACISSNSNSNNNSLVNINTASLNELMTLSGIGESKAKSIISYREKTPFLNKEDLLNVEGIGESIYSSIKENITV